MAIQSSFYTVDGSTVTYPQTKHIPNKGLVAVYLQSTDDESWSSLNTASYDVVFNSVVLDDVINPITYQQIEVRIADTQEELVDSPSDIAIVASLSDEIVEIADTIVPNITEILAADTNAWIATTKADESLASANASEASRQVSDANVLLTNADVVTTNNNVASTNEDVITTNTNVSTSTTQADISTAQAVIATTKANEASLSESTATTQAGIATTQANRAEGYAISIDPLSFVKLTGNQTIAGVKTFNNEIQVAPTTSNKIRFISENFGAFFRADDNNVYLMVTAEDDPYGTYTNARPLTVSLSSGVCSINGNSRTVTNGVYTTDFTGANRSLGSSGYQKLPGGLIIQWGQASHTAQGQTITFPISFPTNCIAVCPVDSENTTKNLGFAGVHKNVNGFNIYSSPGVLFGFFYIAFGY